MAKNKSNKYLYLAMAGSKSITALFAKCAIKEHAKNQNELMISFSISVFGTVECKNLVK